MTTASPVCPLCRQPATVTDWQLWTIVSGCQCGGYCVWKPVWAFRLFRMADRESQALALRIRIMRAQGAETWLSTMDDRVGGQIVLSSERPW